MGKFNRLKKKVQYDLPRDLPRADHKVFQKVCTNLIEIEWSPCIEYDSDWGWVILADRKFDEFGTVLRRIRPFRLNSLSDFQKALKLQERFRKHLVEVVPFKIFLGNKIHVPAFSDELGFLSEANSEEWAKYFNRQNFRLESESIDEAETLEIG